MKSWKYYIICLQSYIIAILIVVLLLSGCNQQSSDSNLDDSYDYPIKPGTEEWKAFTSHDQMLKACQIPENILKNISTKGLVETVLNYPLLLDMMAYNSIQYGFDRVVSGFNGLQELFNRKDAGTELSARYRNMDPAAIKGDWTNVQKGFYAFSFQNIEVILAQEPILINLTSAQRRGLLEECLAKYQEKQQLVEIYGKYEQESTIRLMGRVLQQESYASFTTKVSEDAALKNFLTSGSFSNDLVRSEILSQAKQAGLSVEEVVEFTEAEKAKMNDLIEKLPVSVKEEFNAKYEAWKATWDAPSLSLQSNPRAWASSTAYKELLDYCEKQGEQILVLVIEPLQRERCFIVKNLLEDLTLGNYGFILEKIREDSTTERYDGQGALIITTFEDNWMKYAKELLALL